METFVQIIQYEIFIACQGLACYILLGVIAIFDKVFSLNLCATNIPFAGIIAADMIESEFLTGFLNKH